MKRILTMILLSCAMFAHVNAAQIPVDLSSERIKESHSDGNQPRGPICPPSASIDGYIFYINSSHPDYVLQLVDANDGETVLFETFVPESVNSVVLPSTFEGEYRIQLIWGYWCFWGYVTL